MSKELTVCDFMGRPVERDAPGIGGKEFKLKISGVNYTYDPWAVGYLEGEKCNRMIDHEVLSNGQTPGHFCQGIIEDYGKEGGCYCHMGHPPCSYCTTQNQYCSECGWEAEDA